MAFDIYADAALGWDRAEELRGELAAAKLDLKHCKESHLLAQGFYSNAVVEISELKAELTSARAEIERLIGDVHTMAVDYARAKEEALLAWNAREQALERCEKARAEADGLRVRLSSLMLSPPPLASPNPPACNSVPRPYLAPYGPAIGP